MKKERAVRVSRLLSFALRHDPAALGLRLDAAGWVDVDLVLAALAARGEPLSLDELREVVRTSDKQRFALGADDRQIRANQGHSVRVDLGLPPCEPPDILFHGTVERFLDGIRAAGIVRGARTHVHLSSDEAAARIVAERRAGTTVLLRVRAAAMRRDGHLFYRSENGVWLTEHVPASFVELPPR